MSPLRAWYFNHRTTIPAILSIFIILGTSGGLLLYQTRHQSSPVPSPIPTVTPTTTPTPTLGPTISPTPSPMPTASPTNTPPSTPNPTATPTTQPTPAPTPVPPTPTISATEIQWGKRTKKQVIFTFDAGAGTQSLQPILATLAAHQLHATFFLTGTWASQNQTAVKQIASSGHEIFNHTYTHPHLTQVTDQQIIDELDSADQLISSLTGHTTKPYFRAPYGERNVHILTLAAQHGYQSVYWTIDALDWQTTATDQQVTDRVLTNLKPGTIYLMHIGDNVTGQVLPNLINQIQAQGYSISTLSQGLH